MIRIHKEEKPLRKGSIKLLAAAHNVLAFARFQGDEQIIVVLNNSKELKEITIPVLAVRRTERRQDGAPCLYI